MSAEKEFVLTHIYKDVSSMKENVSNYSPPEEHCRVPWRICTKRLNDHLAVYLHCEQKQEKEWSIETWAEMKITAVNGKSHSKTVEYIYKEAEGWGRRKFIEWEDMMKDYVIDDTLKVEIYVKIKKITGIAKKNLMNFDESTKEFSDVILVAENQKFYVSKLFIARHSSHFKTLLLGKLNQSEFTLQNTDSAHFQYFLELLHGENPIDDDTVDGILKISDVYNSPICVKRCEQFLMEKSAKSLVSKFEISMKFKMAELKKKCIEDIKSTGDIREIVESTSENIDLETTKALLNKSINL